MDYLRLVGSFLFLGATSWGGIWANWPRIEREVCLRRGWITPGKLQEMLTVCTLVPGPNFVSLGAMIGYRVRGWPGAAVGLVALITPGVLLILLGVMLLPADALTGPLGKVSRMIGVAMAGVLLGNAWRLGAGARSERRIGAALAAATAAAILLGAPPAAAVLIALVAGIWLLRGATA